MVQKDEINIKVPYMASKIVLLENTNPDTMVLVNYQRKHSLDNDHLVYHVSYDFQTKEMIFTDISDSIEYNFLLEARNKENTLSRFKNFSFLLLINKSYIGVSAFIEDFDASFELTAMPVLDIDRIAMLDIYSGNSPMRHSFSDRLDYISIGSPDAAYMQKVTEFSVQILDKSVSKKILDERTYRISTQFTLVIDQGQIKGMPTMKDSTVYTQTIDHDVLSGTLKITELAHKIHKLNTFIELVEGPDGDVEERLVYRAYVQELDDRAKTYWLKDFIHIMKPKDANASWETAYGKNMILFETGNTAETQAVVTKIDGTTHIIHYNSSGVPGSEEHSTYQSTDYTNPDLTLRMIIQTVEK